MEFTTMERLQMKVSASYGAVLKFGDKVFVTDCHWKGGFTAEIYEFVETPDETGLGDIECRLAPWGMFRGYVTALTGRGLDWQSRGQRFDPAYLHQEKP